MLKNLYSVKSCWGERSCLNLLVRDSLIISRFNHCKNIQEKPIKSFNERKNDSMITDAIMKGVHSSWVGNCPVLIIVLSEDNIILLESVEWRGGDEELERERGEVDEVTTENINSPFVWNLLAWPWVSWLFITLFVQLLLPCVSWLIRSSEHG